MSVKELADSKSQEIVDLLGADAAKTAEVSRIIEGALLDVMRTTRESFVQSVNICCSADQDLAHKIAEDMHRKEVALVANLNSMR